MTPETFSRAIVSIERTHGLSLDARSVWLRMDATPCGRGWVGTKPPGCKQVKKANKGQKGPIDRANPLQKPKESLPPKIGRQKESKVIDTPKSGADQYASSGSFKRIDKLSSLDEWNDDIDEARNHANYLSLKTKDDHLQTLSKSVDSLKSGERKNLYYPVSITPPVSKLVGGTKEQWVAKIASDRKALSSKIADVAKGVDTSRDLSILSDNVTIVDEINKLRKSSGYLSGGVSVGGKIQAAYILKPGKDHLVLEYLATNPASLLKKGGVKGAGTAAIKAVIERSIEGGFKGKVKLLALDGAAGFYKKLGFTSKDGSSFELSAAAASKILKGKS